MKTIVHVNQHVIKANAKNGTDDPVLTVKTYKENRYAHEVEFVGPVTLVSRPHRPLSCGARVWMETEGEVIVHTERRCEWCKATEDVKLHKNELLCTTCRSAVADAALHDILSAL